MILDDLNGPDTDATPMSAEADVRYRPIQQEPTDAEVEAAAIALYNDDESWGFVVEFAYGTQAVEWDDLGDGPREMFREFARRALRAARRDEEKR